MSFNDMLKSNKARGLELKIDKVLAEIPTAIPSGKTVDVGGKTFTVDELTKMLQTYKEVFARPRETRNALRNLVVDRMRLTPEVTAFLTNLRMGLVGVLGPQNPLLEELGFPPRKARRTPSASEQKDNGPPA